ncbi:ADP-glyceromanno-heptose 6-epimerase [Luteibaculum oceani]|uniref:ADP-L-glycero-D-manno-heptose-6-epimerase n=1 Tax=Luteibaculum oceani TaxID=1294296 RepID=A0A5C6UYA4_9FLAO|nr:ADP-glyceromanno-heptose 6-epimerase [Luteibaculum oceani]TXC78392.1 ADP-glyceromanno-heptose 6-epimerase [Luteibaculum oceani]
MIVVTGAAGFIGSCLSAGLLNSGYKDIVLVDDFSQASKEQNHINKSVTARVDRKDFTKWLVENQNQVQFVFHLGARTDTTEFDYQIFQELNVDYSKAVWNICVENGIPLVYASSAATYGLGELGYKDDHGIVSDLKPLNPYGESKNEFDKWVLEQEKFPPFWAGLKFFNVYGPNEYHKGRMASVVFHAFNQIQKNGEVKLFRSHREDYEDGKQLRDFIYVKDLVNVCIFLMENREHSGLYNLGTGKARAFLDLAQGVFKALDLKPNISFVDTPEDIRDKYQYFTEAKMGKLRDAGYEAPFTSLEDGISDYVKNYLLPNTYY